MVKKENVTVIKGSNQENAKLNKLVEPWGRESSIIPSEAVLWGKLIHLQQLC